jgi:hypothetical protein
MERLTMIRLASLFLSVATISFVYGQVDTSQSKFWMMTYFVNGQDYDGPRLAFSSDSTGIQWQPYGGANPLSSTVLFKPVALPGADGNRCRDPMTAYDSVNKRFNMIWTTEWTGKVIGWDTSSLLKPNTWGPQVALSVGTSMNASYSWAPEIFWDDIQGKWMIYWSVSVSGVTTRIYYSMITGSDFKTFSTPQVLFNPGYEVIDADIIKVAPGNYQMLFKDERNNYKYIRRASGATTPQGPYPTVSAAISTASMEGPSIVKQGNEYHAFIDNYGNQGIYRLTVSNIETTSLPWPRTIIKYGTGNVDFKVSHCNVIEVPKLLVKWMFYNDSAWVRFVNNKVDMKEINYLPVKTFRTGDQNTEIKAYDLLGKVVRLDKILIKNNSIKEPNTNGLTTRIYITEGKKKNIAPR